MEYKLGVGLRIALDTPQVMRENTTDLNVGYNSEFGTWHLIIRYIGDLEDLAKEYNLVYTELLGGYGIVEIEENQIMNFVIDRRIVYIEKPNLFFQNRASINGFVESCMSVPYFNMELRGEGVTVAIIDSGIDVFHPDFMLEQNSQMYSKIIGLWDQSVSGNPPVGYNIGTYFDKEAINYAINQDNDFLSIDITGHGTAVSGIVSACVPMAKLLIIKLNTSQDEQTDTINLMQGIDFAVRYSIDNNIPMVVNLSYGNNYGDHNGNSVLEKYIDYVSQISKISFVVGAGNDGAASRHATVIIEDDSEYVVEFQVSKNEKSINFQIWHDLKIMPEIYIITPTGISLGPLNKFNEIMTYNVNTMEIRILNSESTPININKETYVSVISLDNYIEDGIWLIKVNSVDNSYGRLDFYLPVEGSTGTNIYFLNPELSNTLTIPSTANNVITVGAYNSSNMTYASFSGRGYTIDGVIKPDIVAPGVDIDTAQVGGGYTYVTGTSFSTPFVTAAAAMLMEYGIVRENDVFLYGEKLKAYLIDGSKAVFGIKEYPDYRVGWGALCVENSILYDK